MADHTKHTNHITHHRPHRPFYKHRWFRRLLAIIIVIIILVIIGLGAIWKKNALAEQLHNSKVRFEQTTTNTSTTNKQSAQTTPLTYTAIGKIKLGDLTKNAVNGTSYQTLTQQFGQPNKTKSATVQGVKTKEVTWTNVTGSTSKAKVKFNLVKNHVYSKDLTNYQAKSRAKSITAADYDTLTAQATTYKDTIATYGKPDSYLEQRISGSHLLVAKYFSGLQGSSNASIRLVFQDGVLDNKSQTGME
ncbi:hypothetical protein BSQ39_04640 [Loigolactobacillus backii]|uniref:DUF3862 domain-containing protein n=1 Tax=Loigolactobacillus backii TaxID=375175 RepID=UPI000C1CB67D|nr:DUF3862 domain-containing protein [Loigolactobacillus backii]PIO82909.1 hypothetical protein BSQ39_04640 [Loigolactobacillus backii]